MRRWRLESRKDERELGVARRPGSVSVNLASATPDRPTDLTAASMPNIRTHPGCLIKLVPAKALVKRKDRRTGFEDCVL